MKVSVAIVTYNHEKYIAQAIESVLMQQVDFDYEIVIGEDCSTDLTRQILIEFKNKFPEKIKLVLHKQNVGSKENFTRTLTACQGEYIAILDGDDYWISPDKLQKQVNFLDRHPECTICFHSVKRIYENGRFVIVYPPGKRKFYTLKDLFLHHNFIPACSTMFRNGLFDHFPSWFYIDQMPGDLTIHILNAQRGNIGYIDDIMGIHQYHSEGIWSSVSDIPKLKTEIEMCKIINSNLNFQYNNIIKYCISKKYLLLANHFAKENNRKLAWEYINRAITTSSATRNIFSKDFFSVILKLFCPKLFLKVESFKNHFWSQNYLHVEPHQKYYL